MLSFEDIIQAKNRISNHTLKTELFVDDNLNKEFDNQIFFKLDNRQKTGSFKIRGALNHILMLKEQGKMPKKLLLSPLVIMVRQLHMLVKSLILNV